MTAGTGIARKATKTSSLSVAICLLQAGNDRFYGHAIEVSWTIHSVEYKISLSENLQQAQ